MELTWKAIYSEGESLNQYNEDGSVNKYIDIDRSKLHSFELYKEEQLIFRLILEEGQRLIFRRRVAINLEGDTKSFIYFSSISISTLLFLFLGLGIFRIMDFVSVSSSSSSEKIKY